jgi:fructosamine-3-kinase
LTLPPRSSDVRTVPGGDINEAYRVRLATGDDAFVKTRARPNPGEYEAEAAGLGWLADARALPTPAVLDVAHDYLALEWIDAGALDVAGAEDLGRGLARVHAAGAPRFGDPGGIATVWLGPLRLSNASTLTWPEFYAARRLEPLAIAAREARGLSAAGSGAIAAVCERSDDLAGPPEPPARLHGDLWSGNVLADRRGQPWLIDPSPYAGHREVDLAMLRLFGGLAQRTFDAYCEEHPLADGWRDRVELYQLLPLLVHAALFGGSYGAGAERAARRYVG